MTDDKEARSDLYSWSEDDSSWDNTEWDSVSAF
jgi:hypothetical protein